MKGLFLLSFFLFTLSTSFSQEITATLSGSASAEGFSILNSDLDTLFRVRGDGAIGIGTKDPVGLFDIRGKSGIGRGINIFAEDNIGGIAGAVNISGADGTAGGDLNLFSGQGVSNGGNISITAGYGDEIGGNVNIKSGGGGAISGDINIETGNSSINVGNLLLKTGSGNSDGSASIELTTGIISGGGNDINLHTGNSAAGGGNILLTVDSNDPAQGGGDIILTPNPNGGLVKVIGSGTYTGDWTHDSDQRFKKNIKPLQHTLEKLQQIDGVSFEFRQDEFPERYFSDGKHIGLIAQNVEKFYPELVKTDAEGYKSVAYQNMVAILIEAVKEQQRSINELKMEVEKLKSLNNAKNVEVSSIGN